MIIQEIKTPQGNTNFIEVTEGALQREELSPNIFNIFINDFEISFIEAGFEGVSIDEKNDLLCIGYADDIALFAHSYVDAKKKKLNFLKTYCDKKNIHKNG